MCGRSHALTTPCQHFYYSCIDEFTQLLLFHAPGVLLCCFNLIRLLYIRLPPHCDCSHIYDVGKYMTDLVLVC